MIQVYLRPTEKECLDRLTARLETTKSDVLRRGLEALRLRAPDFGPRAPLSRPRIIGIVSVADGPEADVARDHDALTRELRRQIRSGARIVTTNLVVAETHALLLRRARRRDFAAACFAMLPHSR